MGLAERMFARDHTCPIRSDCSTESNRQYFDSLFTDDWEVFVIKRNQETDGFDWFTLGCEAANRSTYGE